MGNLVYFHKTSYDGISWDNWRDLPDDYASDCDYQRLIIQGDTRFWADKGYMYDTIDTTTVEYIVDVDIFYSSPDERDTQFYWQYIKYKLNLFLHD